MNNQNGFTLIELMICIVLLIILAAISTRYFGDWQKRSRLESDTGSIYALIQQARTRAFTEKLNLNINFVNPKRICATCDTTDTACLALYSGNVTCLTMQSSFAGNGLPISISDRGFYTCAGTIYYNGPAINQVFQSCIKVSSTRARMGKWDGATCNLQ